MISDNDPRWVQQVDAQGNKVKVEIGLTPKCNRNEVLDWIKENLSTSPRARWDVQLTQLEDARYVIKIVERVETQKQSGP
jgi:hypothetical protein